MSLATIIILVNLVGFGMLLIHLLTRPRTPRITTVTRRADIRQRANRIPTHSEAE